MALSVFVWAMIGIALWHFTVFVPDRFWGGIVGAFLAALAAGFASGVLPQPDIRPPSTAERSGRSSVPSARSSQGYVHGAATRHAGREGLSGPLGQRQARQAVQVAAVANGRIHPYPGKPPDRTIDT
jgi:hypothetical protein